MKRFIPHLALTLLLTVLSIQPGEPAPSLTFAFVGDVMLGRGVEQALAGDWPAAFADVCSDLTNADVTFGNLESPLTNLAQGRAGYDLRAPPDAVQALQTGGFTHVSLANNHALDAGPAGLARTRQALRHADIVGVPHKDLRCTSRWCLLALGPLVSTEATIQAVEDASTTAEGRFLIISLHWGGEYQAAPSDAQRALARSLVQAGADLIVGHGPHVLQRIEWIDGAPIAYSLGNFLFDQHYPVDCHQGAILRATVRGDRVVQMDIVPTVSLDGCVCRATGSDKEAILRRLALPTSH